MKNLFVILLVLVPGLLLAESSVEELEAQVAAHGESGDNPALMAALARLGEARQGLGELDAALDDFRQSLRIARQIDDQPVIARNLAAIGRIHLRQDRYPAAAETLRRAVVAATEIDAESELSGIHFSLSETYAAMGRYQEAYGQLQRYASLASAAAAAAGRQQAIELEARLLAERQQQDREIAALREQLEERQSAGGLAGRTRQLTIAALGGGAVLLLLAGGSLLAWHRLKKSTSRQLADRDLKLDQTVSELEQLGERHRREISELKDENATVGTRLAELERFVSTFSHDMKVPLSAVRGFLGSLERDGQAGDVHRMRKDVEQIHGAVGKMTRLLDKLLEATQGGRMVASSEGVWMSELAREAVEQVAGLVAARQVEIAITPEMPVAVGDRAQLLEALRNLVENAVKFIGDQPSPQVEVGWRRDGGLTVFYVKDNGIGIDLRYHDMVFGRFVRLDKGKEGLGVGLDLVKRIIEAHGGRVWVESEGEGQGSTFCFTLAEKGRSRM